MSGDGSIEALRGHVEAVTSALERWAERDPSTLQPEVRRAGNEAVAAIDAMAGELRRLRYRLAAEIREGDQAGAARANAYLDALGQDRGGAR